ncbi:MAG TPA: zinc ribbon domain-containing protein [Ilumatobacter sp.]|nr:zinc ribbon domain-containing protein [Ilumatobacter sp.]
MAVYEYRCRTCDDTFEQRRPMTAAGDPAECPQGHTDTVRLLSMFARAGVAAGVAAPAASGGGGCCGGGCGCR